MWDNLLEVPPNIVSEMPGQFEDLEESENMEQ